MVITWTTLLVLHLSSFNMVAHPVLMGNFLVIGRLVRKRYFVNMMRYHYSDPNAGHQTIGIFHNLRYTNLCNGSP